MQVTRHAFIWKTPLSLDSKPSLGGSRHPLNREDQEASQQANGRALRSPLLAFTVYVTSNVPLYYLQLISLMPDIMRGSALYISHPSPLAKGLDSVSDPL